MTRARFKNDPDENEIESFVPRWKKKGSLSLAPYRLTRRAFDFIGGS